jgi:phytoene dehydrogenase-like protein
VADVVIIGAGVNGLVAAAFLAQRKRSVVVLDQRATAGGAAVTTEFEPGFRAPTLSHALGPISEQVIREIGLAPSQVDLIQPDPALVTLGRNGEAVAFHLDPARSAASIASVSPEDARRWPEFVESSQRLGALSAALAAHAPPDIDHPSARDVWRLLGLGRQARALGRADLARALRYVPMAVGDLASEWFEHELLRAAIAAPALMGHLAGPRSAGTGGMLLQRLAADPFPPGRGVTMRGGPGAFTAALASLAVSSGAAVRTGTRVTRIAVEQRQVRGVVLDSGETIPADVVLSAVDPKQTFLRLLTAEDLPSPFLDRMRHFRARGVTMKVNLALSGPQVFAALGANRALLHARLLIAPDLAYLERAFDAAKYGRWSPAPWLELVVPTATDPTLAPDGQHVMSVYAHLAPRDLRAGSWLTEAEPCTAAVMDVLSTHAPGIEKLVVGREIITPEDLETRWGLSGGHIFHGEMALDQSWIARPQLGWSRYATPVRGLFAGSAGTHPGGGLTGVSGLLAARAVHQALGSRR